MDVIVGLPRSESRYDSLWDCLGLSLDMIPYTGSQLA
jgi:hypothetical protein